MLKKGDLGMSVDKKIQKDAKIKDEEMPTPSGEFLWKLPEDDIVDVDEVFECSIIPGTAGVEC